MLADLERHLGHERRAQELLEQSARVCERIGIKQRQALYLGFLAESYWASGAMSEALERLEDAAELAGFTLSHALLIADLGGYDEALPWLLRFAVSEPDAHRRVAALTATARIHWQERRIDEAAAACDRALEVLARSPADRFWLPAAALSHAVRGEIDHALAALERARDKTSPYLFAEAAIDVGRALTLGSAPESAARLFLSITSGAHHGAIGYHLDDLRSRLMTSCGLLHEAQETWQRARATATELIAALPDDYVERLRRHPWIQELERPRVI
jgi:tetratricopeptide (TPR) repeat protein